MSATLSDWQRAPSVRAEVNYLLPMDRRPQIVNDDYSRNDMDLVGVEVDIADASRLERQPSIDREGFTLVTDGVLLGSEVVEERQLETYRNALAGIMRTFTGADEVAIAPTSIVRRQQPSAGVGDAPPVNFIHSDYSEKGPEQIRPRYGPPTQPGVRRTALFNMWKLLSTGPTDRPLALCDARTVAPEDMVPGDSRFLASDFVFETAFFRHAVGHRWYYYPALRHDEIIVFKQGDTDAACPRFVPHTAFTDRSCPDGAEPRVSLELRCRAVWFD